MSKCEQKSSTRFGGSSENDAYKIKAKRCNLHISLKSARRYNPYSGILWSHFALFYKRVS